MAEVVDAQAARARPKMTFMADMVEGVSKWRRVADFGACASLVHRNPRAAGDSFAATSCGLLVNIDTGGIAAINTGKRSNGIDSTIDIASIDSDQRWITWYSNAIDMHVRMR